MSSWPKLVVSILGMMRSFALWPPKQPIFLGLGASDWTGCRQNLTWRLKLMALFFA
jgi:hypothetical protein